jgi:tubulin-folding cofactor B
MAFQSTPLDVSVIVTVAPSGGKEVEKVGQAFATERRITPSWTVSQLKTKLETNTGIPPGSQRLRLKAPGQDEQWMEPDERTVGDWRLVKGSEIEVGPHSFHSARAPLS